MPDMTMAPAEDLPALPTIPLPRFGRQPTSDPLPDGATLTPAGTDSLSEGPHPEGDSPSLPPATRGPGGASGPPPVPSLEPPTPTRTSLGGGANAKTAGEVFAGLVGLLCGIAFSWAGRRGWHFRQPTEQDIDDFSIPLGKIVGRHVDMALISPDLLDGTRAVKAAHSYAIRGPLFTPYPNEPQEGDQP